MKHPLLHHWIERIYATRDTEIDCDECQAGLPAYVDAEIAGSGLPDVARNAIQAHLLQCSDCAEECEALLAVAEMEAQSNLSEVEDLLAQFETEAKPDHPLPTA